MSLIGISGRVLSRDTVQLKSSDTNYLSVGIGLTGYNFGDDKLYRAVVTGNINFGCLMEFAGLQAKTSLKIILEPNKD